MFRHGIASVGLKSHLISLGFGKRHVSRSSAVTQGIFAERRSPARPVRTSHPSYERERFPSPVALSVQRRNRDRDFVAEVDEPRRFPVSTRYGEVSDRRDFRSSRPRQFDNEDLDTSFDPIYNEPRRQNSFTSIDGDRELRRYQRVEEDVPDSFTGYGRAATSRNNESSLRYRTRDDDRGKPSDDYSSRSSYRQRNDRNARFSNARAEGVPRERRYESFGGDRSPALDTVSTPYGRGDRRQYNQDVDNGYAGPRSLRKFDAGPQYTSSRDDSSFRRSDPHSRDRFNRRDAGPTRSNESSSGLGFTSSELSKSERLARHFENAEGSQAHLDNNPPPGGIPFTHATSEFLYGANTVLAALKAKRRKMHKLYVHPDCREFEELTELARSGSIGVVQVGNAWKPYMDRRSEGRPHNGALLETAPLDVPTLAAISKSKPQDTITKTAMLNPHRQQKAVQPLRLLLTDILDPQNLGSVLRSAYFLGVEMVVLDRRTCAPLTGTAMKASAGAAEAIPLAYTDFGIKFVADSKSCKWNVFAAHLPPSTDHAGETGKLTEKTPTSSLCNIMLNRTGKNGPELHELFRNSPTLLVVGGEGKGLSNKILQQCHGFVNVRAGRNTNVIALDSLNVGVATALCTTELLDQISKACHMLPGKSTERDAESKTSTSSTEVEQNMNLSENPLEDGLHTTSSATDTESPMEAKLESADQKDPVVEKAIGKANG